MRLHVKSGLLVGDPLRGLDSGGRPVQQGISRLVRRWWKRQQADRAEDELLETGSMGRAPVQLVAPMVGPILLVPLILVLREPENKVALLCLIYGTIAIGYGTLARLIERRIEHAFWVQLVNELVYATIISLLLWTFLTVDHPRLHAHWIIFFLYFLLIGAMGLADDPRLCVLAGAFSIIGYVTVILLVQAAAAQGRSEMAVRMTPELEWVANYGKVALLAAATLLSSASASRGRSLRRMSLRDGLTGLLNRHAFDRCLEHAARRARSVGQPLSLAMIDIDHFKRLNDNHGHALGDSVLRWVSSCLRRNFRATDVVARYGGEEFVVAVLDTDDGQLRDRLEALRCQFERATLRRPGSEVDIQISVSIGVASLPADGESVERVLDQADKRLYEAKLTGRNRIVYGPIGG